MYQKIMLFLTSIILFIFTLQSYAIAPGAGQAQMRNNMQQMQQNKQQMQQHQKMLQQKKMQPLPPKKVQSQINVTD